MDKVNDQIKKYNEKLASLKESMDSIDRNNDYDEEGKLLGEYEEYTRHLDTAQRMKAKLNTVDRDRYTENIQFGSIIETEKNYYFIAVGLGKIDLEDGSSIFAVSTEAPIYEKLEGKKEGDTFEINNQQMEILKVH